MSLLDSEFYAQLRDRDNLSLRTYWINALRDIVGRRCPKNKMGAPIVSDVDILLASAAEFAEAQTKTENWKLKHEATIPETEGVRRLPIECPP